MRKIINGIGLFSICIWLLAVSVSAARMLVPGGQIVGLELGDNTVTVSAIDENLGAAAKDAGLKVGDRILKVNGRAVHKAEDVQNALHRCDGVVELAVLRDKKELTVRMLPTVTQDGPKLGVYLKQGVTGVGTVTWYDPESNCFATLGHGVNNAKGELLKLTYGNAYKASVVSVRKGACGQPGQLMGALQSAEPIGKLSKNTNQGVFGTAQSRWDGQAIPVASPSEVKTGPAVIRSTVRGNEVQEYSVEILKVYPGAGETGRNLLIHITDEKLLAATGGIVQGMSGCPIIQDGKLIGAVTHVLVNDPATGYGIFVENMLNAAA